MKWINWDNEPISWNIGFYWGVVLVSLSLSNISLMFFIRSSLTGLNNIVFLFLFCKRAHPCLSGRSSASERVSVYLVLFCKGAGPCLSCVLQASVRFLVLFCKRAGSCLFGLQASVRLPSARHSWGEVILLFSLHIMLATIISKFCFCSGLLIWHWLWFFNVHWLTLWNVYFWLRRYLREKLF